MIHLQKLRGWCIVKEIFDKGNVTFGNSNFRTGKKKKEKKKKLNKLNYEKALSSFS